MLYENYERFIRFKYRFIKFVKTNKIFLYVMLSLACLLLATFSITKGMIYDTDIPESFEYGETLEFNSKAVFSRVEYSYSLAGEDNWTDEVPVMAGEYQVRVSTNTIFSGTNTQVFDFTITQKTSDVSVLNNSVIYGETPDLVIDLSEGDYIDDFNYVFDDILLNQSDLDISNLVIKNIDGINVTNSYLLNTEIEAVTINPRPVNVTLINQRKVYDGESLSSNEVLVSGLGLVNGQTITVTASGSITNVGTQANQITDIQIFDGTTNVTGKYTINQTNGTLEVTQREITISTESDSFVYDDITHSNSNYTIVEGELVSGHIINVVSTTNIIDVGQTNNVLGIEIEDALGTDVLANYNITYQYGLLQVQSRDLSFTSGSSSKTYDGTSLEDSSYTIPAGQLIAGHTINILSNPSIMNVGQVDNIILFEILDASNRDVTNNYHVELLYGLLEIEQIVLNIQTASETLTYDGLDHQNLNYTFNSIDLVSGHTINILGSTTVNDVDTVENVLTFEIRDALNNVVTDNYSLLVSYGSLTINQLDITVKPEDTIVTYNGDLQSTVEAVDVFNTLAAGHRIEITTSVNEANVFIYTNNITSIEILDGNDRVVTDNYNIATISGTFEITQLAITVKPTDQEKVYDGLSLTSLTADDLSGTLVSGHTIVITSLEITDFSSITNSIQSIIIRDSLGADVTLNYDITQNTGTLTITQRALSITTASDTKVYDGTPLSNSGYTITSGSLAPNQTINVINDRSMTDAKPLTNDYTIEILDIHDVNVISNYDITYTYGLLEVFQRDIYIKANDATKEYDGLALTNNTYSIIGETSIVAGQTIDSITISGSQTVVGTSFNTVSDVIIMEGSTEVTPNYNIVYYTGNLVVTERLLSVSTASDSKVYDDIELFNQTYSLTSGTLVTGHHLEIDSYTTIINAETVQNVIILRVEDSSNQDVSSNYDISYTYGDLTITPLTITLRPDNVSEIYNGQVITSTTATDVSGHLIAGHTISFTSTESLVNVGLVTNYIDPNTIQIMSGLNDVTANYDISYLSGTIEVTQRDVIFIANDLSKVYDGQAFNTVNMTIDSGSLAPTDNFTFSNTIGDSQVTGGLISYHNTVNIYNASSELVNSNYNINYIDANYEISVRNITIRLDDLTVEYDGTLHFYDSHFVHYDVGSLANNQSLEIVTTGSQKYIGTVVTSITDYTIYDASMVDQTSNYTVTTVGATLEVTQYTLSISTASYSKIYDAQPISSTTYILTSQLPQDHTITLDTYTEFTNVDSRDNVHTYIVRDSDGIDVTYCINFDMNYGTLEISQVDLFITTSSASKIYDGTALTSPGYSIDSGDLVTNQTINQLTTTSLIDVDTVQNIQTFEIRDTSNQDVTSNYNIQITYGTLEVTALDLYITTGTDSKTYDGLVLSDSTYTITQGDLYTNHTINVLSTKSIVNAETVLNDDFIIEIRDASNNLVTDNYNIVYTYGSLTINKRVIEVTTHGASKIYDGAALSNLNYTETSSNLVAGHTINVISGTQHINATDVDNILALEILDGTTDVTDNYTINYTYGTLSISKLSITVRPENLTKTYDGTALTASNGVDLSGTLVAGHYIEVVSSNSITNVDSVTNNAQSVTIYDATDQDVTANYQISTSSGTLTITQLDVTIKPEDAVKEYDGTALTPSTHEFTVNGLVDTNQTLTYDLSGTQTAIGSSTSTISNVQIFDGTTNITSNYNISYATGTLTVTLINIEFRLFEITKIYTGSEITHAPTDYWIPTNNLPAGYTVTFDILGSITDVGFVITNIDEPTIIIYDESMNDVTTNFGITTTSGKITVTQRNITITSGTSYKIYDGTPLTDNTYSITNGSLATGHTESVTITGSQTERGTSENTIDPGVIIYDASMNDVTSNYNITLNPGDLIVL